MGFTASVADPSLFVLQTSQALVILLLYVDDIVITGTDSSLIQSLIQQLHTMFELKDLGQLSYFLGLELHHSSKGLFFNQSKYITDILKKHNMLDCKPCSIPCASSTKLTRDDGTPLDDPSVYRSLVGSL